MEGFDLVHALVQLGVGERQAEDLKTRLTGQDFLSLVNALNTDEIGPGVEIAKNILRKYKISLGGSEPVATESEYKAATMEALKRGDLFAVEEFINEWLSPVSESSSFNYALSVTEQSMDRVLDWLEENQFEYQATGPNVFHVSCGDRAGAYKVSRALSEIMSKPVVRDSANLEEEPVSEKNTNRREREAREKLANMKDRNPVAAGMVHKTGGGAHGKGNPKKDTIRGHKHKGRFDEGYAVGDDVIVGEQHGTVKIPRGPNGTIGVILDGELSMVAESDVSRLDEGVLGMTSLNPLFRLRELAGLAPAPMQAPEDDLNGPDDLAVGSGADVADLPADDLGGIDDPMADLAGPGIDPMDPTPDIMGEPGAVHGADPMGGDDLDLDAHVPIASVGTAGMDDMGGMPGDLPPMPAEPGMMAPGGMPMAPSQSEAMSKIEDALNGIQMDLADIRLSEYKSLVKKLQDLTNQVQAMGRDYLGERRKK